MIRTVAIAFVLCLSAFLLGKALAATPEAAPTAGPHEIVFYGQVPAPPGTRIVINFVDFKALELRECGSADSTPTADGQTDVSDFVLRIESSCAVVGAGAGICWGERLCDNVDLHNTVQDRWYDGGKTYDVGLLVAPPIGTPTPLPRIGSEGTPIPIASPVDDLGLPDTGSNDPTSGAGALVSVIILLAAGIACAGLAVGLRHRMTSVED